QVAGRRPATSLGRGQSQRAAGTGDGDDGLAVADELEAAERHLDRIVIVNKIDVGADLAARNLPLPASISIGHVTGILGGIYLLGLLILRGRARS
ncbi:MAG TPA: hypothetical protein PLI13_02965, partial [Paracoccus sp. (in: a-proteobacteria)]|nr:hypothetical protein [Paracoccus sp. (in: a-proteobacteria)]